MKFIQFLMAVLVSALVAFFVARSQQPQSGMDASSSLPNAVYARVLKSGVIHCGYSSWKPLFFIDPASGQKRGIFHDLMEETASRLHLTVDWQEELGWGSVSEAVKSGRVDMACSGYYPSGARVHDLSTTLAQLYTPLYVYVRASETRSFAKMDELNVNSLTVARIDGSGENAAVVAHFPSSQNLTLPEMSTSADEIEALLSNKVDFVVLDIATARNYQDANPDKIKQILSDQSVVEFPNVVLIPPGEMRLKEMIDDTFLNIENDGTLDKILKDNQAEDKFLRNAKPAAFEPKS